MRVAVNATSADLMITAAKIHTFDDERSEFHAVAIRDGRILALGDSAEDLRSLVGPQTVEVDARDLVLTPGLFDTHNHQLHTARDLDAVNLDGAATLGEVVALLADRARETPEGEWIVTGSTWHETNLAERRLPTARELDAATTSHPICVRRGGHVRVVNTLGLERAGITADTPDPAGATIARDPDGRPNGQLIEPAAYQPVEALLPKPSFEADVDALGRLCRLYNRRGLVAVRDPFVTRHDLLVYQGARDAGKLTTRSRVMIAVPPTLPRAQRIAEIDSWGVRSGFGDDLLQIDGIKLMADGGVEAAALSTPYANDSTFRGHLMMSADELTEVIRAAVARGWRVGTHAVGDVAVRAVLDAYERVEQEFPGLPQGWLAIEHACFADPEQRQRAIDLGVAITVQHPLLYALGGNMRIYWGDERTAEVFPLREWIDEGALVAAGSDSGPAPWDPLLSIWGMTTRGTRVAGTPGPEHAIDRWTAFWLYSVAGAHLFGDGQVGGAVAIGKLADLVAFPVDPLTCPIDDLPDVQPAFTLLAGEPVFDREGRVSTARQQPGAGPRSS